MARFIADLIGWTHFGQASNTYSINSIDTLIYQMSAIVSAVMIILTCVVLFLLVRFMYSGIRSRFGRG